MITSLEELYLQFDQLLQGISLTCKDCSDPDCEGYIWLLPEEANRLENNGISTVELNGNCEVINPFDKYNLSPEDFEQYKPKCPHRVDLLCSIYNLRPLTCRMYPLGFTVVNSKVVLVLFKDCKFSRDISGINRIEFVNNALSIIDNCSKELYNVIVNACSAMEVLSKTPFGKNEYDILTGINNLV